MRKTTLVYILSLFLSCTLYGQQDTTKADTIALSNAHAQMLPELVKQQAELQKAIQDIQDKIFIMLTGYVDPEKLKGGKVSFGPDQKSIIVK